MSAMATAEKGNGAGTEAPTSATLVSEPVKSTRASKKKGAVPFEPPPELATPEAPPPPAPIVPELDDLRRAITKAVLMDTTGKIRAATEMFKPTIKVNMLKECTEEHRLALWDFVAKNGITVPFEAF
jgi:hypothetical protein